jgi:hypothetical protein
MKRPRRSRDTAPSLTDALRGAVVLQRAIVRAVEVRAIGAGLGFPGFWPRLLRRSASESGRLCPDTGLHGLASRCPKGASVAFAPACAPCRAWSCLAGAARLVPLTADEAGRHEASGLEASQLAPTCSLSHCLPSFPITDMVSRHAPRARDIPPPAARRCGRGESRARSAPSPRRRGADETAESRASGQSTRPRSSGRGDGGAGGRGLRTSSTSR